MMRLIDADALMMVYRRVDYNCPGEWNLRDIQHFLESATTVDAVPVVHGRWVDRYDWEYANQLFECSECGNPALYTFKVDALWHEHIVQVLSDYCPHCGAKMDKD